MESIETNPKKVQSDCIYRSLGGVVIAGALYPACLLLIAFVCQMLFGTVSFSYFLNFQVLLGAFVGVVLGMAVSAIFGGLIVVPMLLLINRTLSDLLDGPSMSVTSGSLTGFLPTILALIPVFVFEADPVIRVAVILLGPVLAATMGAGGAWWMLSVESKDAAIEFDLANYEVSPLRLSVSQLLMATFWIAVLFAVSNLFQSPFFAVAMLGWGFFNAGIVWLFRWHRRRQAVLRNVEAPCKLGQA